MAFSSFELAFSFWCWALAGRRDVGGGTLGRVTGPRGGRKRVFMVLRVCLIARRSGRSSGMTGRCDLCCTSLSVIRKFTSWGG